LLCLLLCYLLLHSLGRAGRGLHWLRRGAVARDMVTVAVAVAALVLGRPFAVLVAHTRRVVGRGLVALLRGAEVVGNSRARGGCDRLCASTRRRAG
jgi:hypothetical protein